MRFMWRISSFVTRSSTIEKNLRLLDTTWFSLCFEFCSFVLRNFSGRHLETLSSLDRTWIDWNLKRYRSTFDTTAFNLWWDSSTFTRFAKSTGKEMFGFTSTISSTAIILRIFIRFVEEHAPVSTDESSDSPDYLLRNWAKSSRKGLRRSAAVPTPTMILRQRMMATSSTMKLDYTEEHLYRRRETATPVTASCDRRKRLVLCPNRIMKWTPLSCNRRRPV